MTQLSTDAQFTTTMNVSVGSLGPEMFGVTAQNMFGTNEWIEDVAEMGLQDGRFPGGRVSENGWVVDGRVRLDVVDVDLDLLQGDRSQVAFDLTHPELISPVALQYDDENHLGRDDVFTFSQMLARAVETETDVSLIIPVERYYLNQDLTDPTTFALAKATAEADISTFLERLKAGEFNNGEYPEVIRFEIGNEQYSNPIEYAMLSKIMVDKISAELSGSDISYEQYIQIGRGSFEFNNLLNDGYFDKFYEAGVAVIPELADLGFVPEPGLPYSERQVATDVMMASILGDSLANVDGVRQHLLDFDREGLSNPDAPVNQRQLILDHWKDAFAAVGIDFDRDIEYYYSAFSTNTDSGDSRPFELAGATNLLEIYGFMLEQGVDRAAIWGVTTAFRYNDGISNTTITDRLSDFDSPQKALLTLLTDHVMGGEFLGSDGGNDEGYRSFTYETETGFTIFYYVDSVATDGTSINVDLGILGDSTHVSVTNLDMAVEGANGASKLVEEMQPIVDGHVDIHFDQDFEIVMIEVDKSDSPTYLAYEAIEGLIGTKVNMDGTAGILSGTDDIDFIFGEEGSDILFGGAGDDVLGGGTGRADLLPNFINAPDFATAGGNNSDFIFGGAGNDTIRGNAGNDLISGDEGDDVLWGGSGFDTFVFTEGSDTIGDFQLGIDTVLIDAELIAGQGPLEDFFERNSTSNGDSLTIDFGNGNNLTISGVGDVDDIMGRVIVSDFEFMGG